MYSDQNIIRSKKDFQNNDISQVLGINFSILMNFLRFLLSKLSELTGQNFNFGQKLDLQNF